MLLSYSENSDLQDLMLFRLLHLNLEQVASIKGIENYMHLLKGNEIMSIMRKKNSILLDNPSRNPLQEALLKTTIQILFDNLDKTFQPIEIMQLDFTLLRAQCEDQYKYLLGYLIRMENLSKIFASPEIKAVQKLKLVDYVLANEKHNILASICNKTSLIQDQPPEAVTFVRRLFQFTLITADHSLFYEIATRIMLIEQDILDQILPKVRKVKVEAQQQKKKAKEETKEEEENRKKIEQQQKNDDFLAQAMQEVDED